MNRLAQQVRQLYYRRASLLYIKANPAQFVPFEETHLDSELKQLTQSIDDVTGAAEDWGIYLFPSCPLFGNSNASIEQSASGPNLTERMASRQFSRQ